MSSLAQIKVSDTSTAESGSEVEEMASPKVNREIRVPKLTPVCEDVRAFLYESENHSMRFRLLCLLPDLINFRFGPILYHILLIHQSMIHQWWTKLWMLLGWPMKSQRLQKVKLWNLNTMICKSEIRSTQSFIVMEYVGAGSEHTPDLGKIGSVTYIWRWLMMFFVNLFTLLISVALPQNEVHSQSESSGYGPNARESRPPSPAFATMAERNVFSSVVNRLGDLEKQVETLHSKRHEMPREKEELLNTAVYRVDALEAELIATKKV